MPAGTAQSMCIASACTAVRRVFVSSIGSTADLGGVAGADGRCQTLANAAQLGGTWRAWVSASGTLVPNTEVWTATNSGGNFTSGGCNGFTSGANGSPTAAQGLSDATDTDWTNIYVQFCDRTTPRIYCFEQ